MCGIVGVITKAEYGFNNNEQKAFEQLLYIDALRGDDATGIFVVNKEGEVKVVKDSLPSSTMAYCKEYTEIVDYAYKCGKVAVGHNRKKTMGKNEDVSAHPFVVNNEFILVHNGTLHSHRQLANTDVDSEALAIHIHEALKENDDEAFDKAMSKVYGAYACVFYDMRTNKLYMMRNAERPLYLAETKSGSYVFASEMAFIYAATNRNSMVVENCFPLEVGVLYSFDLSENKLSKPTARKIRERSTFFPQAPTTQMYSSKTMSEQCGTGFTVVGASNDNSVVDVLSKNMFKKFQKKYLGRKIRFVVEDFMERSVSERVIAEDEKVDWIIFGYLEQDVNTKESYYPNFIQCVVNNTDMEHIQDMYEGVMEGTVSGMEYDSTRRRAKITVINAEVPKDVAAASYH